ncbi:MAG: OmpA family protein [Saprospiraceae bacterium]|nr:OmpA family protein [Saprospiraceae bacterium]
MPALRLQQYAWTLIVSMASNLTLLPAQQLCRGSLGENIFTQGDFGKGIAVLVENDPGIAPGYRYTTWTPVSDGFYTITNNTGRWYRIWPTWLLIGDNSNDRTGYMMIINASYQPGIFYEQTVSGICENTTYEFSADVINLIQRHVPDHIRPNVSFLIDGVEYYNTGFIPQDEQWKQVGFTFTSAAGQTAVRLTLRNNAPGGRGNDLALDNISFRACGPYASIKTAYPNVVCEQSDFPVLNADIWDSNPRALQWQISSDHGQTWQDLRGANSLRLRIPKQAPGTYLVRYVHAASKANLNSEKCRLNSEVFDLVVKPSVIRRKASIRAGESYDFAGRIIRTSGTYRHVFPSAGGSCDSTVILTLTVAADAMRPNYTIRPPSCHNVRDGAVRQNGISGGLPPYSYKWSHGGKRASATELGPGTYVVTITDADGNTITRSFELTAPEPLSSQITMNANNKPTINVRGGLPPYRYAWSNGETTATALRLDPGRQQVIVTDANNCTLRKHVDVKYIAQTTLIPELTVDALRSGAAIRMERVQFDADSSRITPESIPTLRELQHFLEDNPSVMVEIGGHTNGLPEHDYCDRLSTARAKAIADWIIARGIEAGRITYKGYGKRQPIATNATPEGRRQNQRVEVRMVQQ